MTALPDDVLKLAFDEIDRTGSGQLSLTNIHHRRRIRNALRKMGNMDEEIDLEIIQSNVFTFSDFKAMLKGRGKLALIHDVPVVGVVASALEDNVFAEAEISDTEIIATFKRIDVNRNGTLDKTEIAQGFRDIGKSEIQIQMAINSMQSEELDIDGFADLLRPPPRPIVTQVGGVIVPNLGKIHEMPFLGKLTHLAQDLLVGAGGLIGSGFRSLYGLSHQDLKRKFDEYDTDGSGELERKEIGNALRQLGKTEVEIKEVLDRIRCEAIDFTTFKFLVRDSGSSIAIFGQSDVVTDGEIKAKFDEIDSDNDGELSLTSKEYRSKIRQALRELGNNEDEVDLEVIQSNVLTFSGFKSLVKGLRHPQPDDVSEVEMRAAFDRFDKDKSGLLDMTEAVEALREMGQSEMQIQKAVDERGQATNDLNFDDFKLLLEPKPKSLVTVVGGLFYETFRSFQRISKEDLERKFHEADTQSVGWLEKKDLAKVLRSLGRSEIEIKQTLDRVNEPSLTLAEFEALVQPSASPPSQALPAGPEEAEVESVTLDAAEDEFEQSDSNLSALTDTESEEGGHQNAARMQDLAEAESF